MDDDKQPDNARLRTSRFYEELSRVVDYFRKEFDLTYFEAIGGLEVLKLQLFKEMHEQDDDFSEEQGL